MVLASVRGVKGAGALIVCLALATACDRVSPESIERWKTTQKGPAKLQRALGDDGGQPPLRALAFVALVDLGLVAEAVAALAATSDGARGAIATHAIPPLVQGLGAPSVERVRAARDALFDLRGLLPEGQRGPVDLPLLAAIEADLRAGRLVGGRHSIERLLADLGAVATPLVVKLIGEPAVPPDVLADLLVKTADGVAREQAGAALVRRASAAPTIAPALWKALGAVGGKAATDFLVDRAGRAPEEQAVQAARALALGASPAVLPFALRVAGDGRASPTVRDEMFGLVGRIGGLGARQGLLAIIAVDPAEVVRYRAFEVIAGMGKEEGIVPALEAFPAKAAYKREDIVDYLARDIQKLGAAGRRAALGAIESPSVLARLVGVLVLETVGTAADASPLLKLAKDRGTLKGLSAGTTVGAEATRVGAKLGARGN